MLTAQIKSLTRFRAYQRLLIFGSGIFATLMLLIILLTNARMAMVSHTEVLRQRFISEHALLVQNIGERKNSFQNILTGLDIMLSERDKLRDIEPSANSTDSPLTFHKRLADPASRAFYLPEDIQSNSADSRMFQDLAGWISRFMTSDDTTQHSGALSGCLYHPDYGVIDILASNSKTARFTLNQIGDDIDGISTLSSDPLAARIVWLRAPENEQVLRLAAPVMLNARPFATLVMTFPFPAISSPALHGEQFGTMSIQAATGEIITGFSNAPADHSLLAALASVAIAWPGSEILERDSKSGIVFLEPLADSGWLLRFEVSWGEIAAIVGSQIREATLATAGLLLLIWGFLLYFKLRIFRPLIQHSRHIYESEQLNRTLIDTAPLGIGILSVERRSFLLCSPMLQQTEKRLCSGDGALAETLVRSYLRQTSTGRGLVQFEKKLAMSDGQQIDFAISMAPGRYQGDDVLVVAFTDITNKQLLEEQLKAARVAADNASAAKSAFLAAMSHEIRTPLNAILGNLELLSHSASQTQRERLDIIQRASDSLLLTISDILDFSKIEAGELRPEAVPFDLYAVTADVLAIFTPLAAAKGIELHDETVGNKSLPMRGDSTCLRQVLNNLLANALKFTEKGQIALSVNINAEAARAEIAIADTGIGMSPAQLQQVFHAFRQADDTIHRRYGGSGLGLALCSGLVKAMSGTLSASSEMGKGSIFRVSLPLGESIAAEDLPPLNSQPIALPEAAPTALAATLRVLVVEDNPVNRRLLEEQLQLLGCQVFLAREGEEALALLRQQTVDIVLTDLSMPGMDGYELAENLRENWPELPVVAVSANVTQQEYEACYAVGMIKVLAKPLLLNELGQTLAEICPSQPAQAATTSAFGLLGGKPLPDEVRDLFEQTCADSVALIREAIENQSPAVILRELHSLKGAFGVFGMKELKVQTAEISEKIKQSGVIPALPQLVLFCDALEKNKAP